MIDIGKIIKRAWHILWNYRVLWIFGLLLALTAGGNGGSSQGPRYQFSGDRGQYTSSGADTPAWMQDFADWLEINVLPMLEHPDRYISTLIWIGVGIFLFILIFSVIFAIIRYVSETAVIRMVDEYEQSGTRLGFKAGWKLGWNRRAFRLWVINLVVNLPAFLFVSLVFGMGLLIYFSIESGNEGLAASGIVTAIGCTFLFLFFFVIFMIFLNLLRQFFVRFAALEDRPVGESIRQGWALFKHNWKSAALMWLVMLGIGIGFGIVGLIIFFLLIPAYAIMILPAAIVAAIPGLIAFGITSLFSSGPLAWIIAAVFALPVFFTVVFLPLALVNGFYLIFSSNIWTLTYREIKALDPNLPVEPAPPAVA